MSTLSPPAPGYRTPPAIRRALVAAAGLLALALVAIGTYNLLDLAARHTTTQRATYDGVRALVVDGASDVELGSSAGDVTAIDVTAPSITLSSSAGDVEARRLSAGRIDAGSSAGDVLLSLRTPAERLSAESSAGDVDIVVPDAVYRLDATTSAGDVDSGGIRTDPDSPRTISAHSSAGDVTVAPAR